MKAHSTIIACSLFLLFPIFSLWGQSTFKVDGITYRVLKEADESSTFGTVAVTAGNYTGIVNIPHAVRVGEEPFADVYKVVAIEESAFADCAVLNEVSIPVSIESIGNFAFRGCLSLTKVAFPAKSNISALGRSIFLQSGIKSIVLPEGITFLPVSTFYGCQELSEVILPNSLTRIEMYAFSSCPSLKRILLPKNLKTIEASAFSYSGLDEIRIPENVVVIADHLFECCQDLSEVILPNSLARIGMSAFISCSSLKKILLPESLKTIGGSAFSGSRLEEIRIPENVVVIADYLFRGCLSLKHVELSNMTISIGDGAFAGCRVLSEINKPETLKAISQSAFKQCEMIPGYYRESFSTVNYE